MKASDVLVEASDCIEVAHSGRSMLRRVAVGH
jgi:hypothetical protein